MDLIAVDTASEGSILTTAISGDTPTLASDEAPTIRALLGAKTDAEYDHLIATIPREHKKTIDRVLYILYEPYRSKKSIRTAWYWADEEGTQGIELIRITKGMALLTIYSYVNNIRS